MKAQRTRELTILVSALMLAVSVGMMFWPIVSRADTPLEKAGRGLAAITTPFLEVPGNIVAETRNRGPVWGFTLGFATGLGKLVVRELVGVYEFVTAPFPIPSGFQPILEPEFPWGYFEQPAARAR